MLGLSIPALVRNRRGGGVIVVPPPAWTPLQLASQLAGWWDADDAASFTIATGVSQWADRSGSARHLAQSTPSLQPARIANALNGRAGVAFAQKALVCTAALAPVPGAFSLVIVASSDPAGANNRGLVSLYPGGATADYAAGTAAVLMEQMANGSYQSYSANLLGANSGAGLASAGAKLLASEKDASNTFLFRANGALSPVTGATIAASNLATASVILVGARNVGGVNPATYGYAGTLHEIALVGGALPAADRQKLEGYLAAKWGLQALLPAAHPYKSSAP
jgi:hypothetical protein